MKVNLPDHYSRIQDSSRCLSCGSGALPFFFSFLSIVSSQVEAMAVSDGKRQTRGKCKLCSISTVIMVTQVERP